MIFPLLDSGFAAHWRRFSAGRPAFPGVSQRYFSSSPGINLTHF
jgi:hypothetical protein